MQTSWNVMLCSVMYRYWWLAGTAPSITNPEEGNSRFLCNTGRVRLKCDGTHAETRFCLSAKWTSPFKSAGVSVQSTTGSRGARISGSNAGYTMFWGSVKSTGYPLHLPVSPSLPLLCITVCLTFQLDSTYQPNSCMSQCHVNLELHDYSQLLKSA